MSRLVQYLADPRKSHANNNKSMSGRVRQEHKSFIYQWKQGNIIHKTVQIDQIFKQTHQIATDIATM
jgi:hypothetical protein